MDRREPDFVDECYADKDLSQLQKLTLVIPTYNRNYYLSRCLWYHAHFPFGEIIVADSSPEEKKAVNRETVAKIRSLFGVNIRYLEYKPETDKYGEDIYLKWADAIQQVKTEYTKISTDKEFLIPSRVLRCIQYLDENSDCQTADGTSILIRMNNDNFNSPHYDIWTPYDKSYLEDDMLSRVESSSRNPYGNLGQWNMLTAIRKTDFQKWIYNQLELHKLLDLRFGDALPQLLSLVCSKRMHFSDTYLVRDLSAAYEKGGAVKKSESSASRYPGLLSYYCDGIMDNKISSLNRLIREIVYKSYHQECDSHESLSEKIVDLFMTRMGFKYYNNPTISRIYSSRLVNYLYYHIVVPTNRHFQNIITTPVLSNSGVRQKIYSRDYVPLSRDVCPDKHLEIVNQVIWKTFEKHAPDEPII